MLSIAKSLVAACIFSEDCRQRIDQRRGAGFPRRTFEDWIPVIKHNQAGRRPHSNSPGTQGADHVTSLQNCQNASENLEKSDGDLCLTGPGVDVARIRSSLWPETTQAPSVSLEVKWEDVQAAQKRTAELHASPQKIEDSVKDH